ncbi:hypothetical protein Q0Z83_030150 [Actinoplanes sichuanensis]|uniref:Uncharacterized protein n=1 Tax=Actinoplanes sichuanensis TaxID=512349 RepID=A0ABW4ARI6_9ACTN|nr:hypothetical protein [Actinoplanes sichuanensis]BEL04824.1 hypothetical protein Q0Z83_030150 [Actinoplanes sichuanensis]
MTDAYPSRDDRIVAEFGAGYEVEGIAARYGLTVEQVYALVEREVGPVGQSPSQSPPPPAYYPPPSAPGQVPPPPAYYPPPSAPGQVPPPPAYYPPPSAPGQVPPPPAYHPPSAPGQVPPAYYPPPQPGQVPPPPGYQGQPPAPGPYPPPQPVSYAPPTYQMHGFADPDTIVAEYGDGHDVAMIARRHGITVDQVYFIVQQAVTD